MEKKSKKKYIIFSAAVVVIAAVIFVVWSVTSNSTLKKECPALEKGKIVTVHFFESIPGVDIYTDKIELPQEELRSLLISDVNLKRAEKVKSMPNLGFMLHVYENEETYEIIISIEGKVMVAPFDNLQDGRTFWKDPEGKLFDEIYNLCLENGGEKIEAVEEYKNNIV